MTNAFKPKMSRLPEIREAVFSEDFEALNELLISADESDLNPAMFGAVLISNNTDMLELLLKAGANINYQDNYGRTALFLAVKYNRKAVVELLIQNGCDVQLAKYNESNVLHLAAKKGDPDIVKMLIDANHDVNIKNWGGNTALLVASRFGNKAVVNMLLDSGSRLDDCNRLGHTALHYACFQGSKDIVDNLLEHGANPDARTHLGINPMMLACEQNHCTIVELLVNKSNLNKSEKLYGAPVLHWAVASGCLKCILDIVNKGACIYSHDKSGRSPLIQAVQSGKSEVVRLLIDYYKAEDFVSGKVNAVIIHVASYLGRIDCVHVLCDNNKTKHMINHTDVFGETPLDLAIKAGHPQVVSMLVSYGAIKSQHRDGCVSHDKSLIQGNSCDNSHGNSCDNSQGNSCDKSLIQGNSCDKSHSNSFDKSLIQGIHSLHINKHDSNITEQTSINCLDQPSTNDHDPVSGSSPTESSLNRTDPSTNDHDPVSGSSPTESSLNRTDPSTNDHDPISGSSPTKSSLNRTDHPHDVNTDSCSSQDNDLGLTNGSDRGLGLTQSLSQNNTADHRVVTDPDQSLSHSDTTRSSHSDTKTLSQSNTNLKQLLTSESCESTRSITPLYKTYSPVKMSMISMLKDVTVEQMVAKEKFNFNTWLDNGPEAFVLKVVSLDITEWLYSTTHKPWSLREICRGKLRLVLGYRASEKVELLPVPRIIKNYLNMKELEEIDTNDIKIRNTQCYDVIEME